MNLELIAKHVTRNGDGSFDLRIPVAEQFGKVFVRDVTMHVSGELADEDGDYWGDGDLAVNWDASVLQNNGGGNMGTLIMRGWEDEVGEVMGLFYWQHGYDTRVQELLLAAGFSPDAAQISGSEWGMQDEGRASYDAYEVADEVRKAMAV